MNYKEVITNGLQAPGGGMISWAWHKRRCRACRCLLCGPWGTWCTSRPFCGASWIATCWPCESPQPRLSRRCC